jgi:hypothetical protein
MEPEARGKAWPSHELQITSFRTPKGLGEARRQSFDDDILHFQLSLSLSLSPLQIYSGFAGLSKVFTMFMDYEYGGWQQSSGNYSYFSGLQGLRIKRPSSNSPAYQNLSSAQNPARSFVSFKAGRC